jgi:hypothetical protein
LPAGLGLAELRHELLALLLDHGRQASETLDFRACLGDALLERGDLLMGTG